MQRLHDTAEMLFEPTGDLWKDYSAYCEIEDKSERDDIVDAIRVVDSREGGNGKVQTLVTARNLEYCLNKRDAMPLANAIPHCQSLTTVQLTGCGMTEHSLKLIAEAVYKSQSIMTVAVDFNPGGLYRDPTVSKKDKNEVFVSPLQYRGNHLRNHEPEAAASDKKQSKDKKQGNQKAPVEESQDRAAPIALPTGWHSLLLAGIQQLSLRGNNISDRQVEPIAQLLEANTELLSLSLWGNAITSAGAASIAAALRTNRRLTALNLGHNRIDDDGVIAIATALLTSDSANEDAVKLRQRTLRTATAEALPQLPSFADLFAAPAANENEKKDKKGQTAKGKKAEGPVERLKGDFDKDCVRIDDGRVRVPGNTALWAVNLTNNSGISPNCLASVSAILRSREPTPESFVFEGTLPPHHVPSGISLTHFDVTHSGLPADATKDLKAALTELTAFQAQQASRAASAV